MRKKPEQRSAPLPHRLQQRPQHVLIVGNSDEHPFTTLGTTRSDDERALSSKDNFAMELPPREHEREAELSPTSPVEDSDSGFLSPTEPEPEPGLHGVPVRCE